MAGLLLVLVIIALGYVGFQRWMPPETTTPDPVAPAQVAEPVTPAPAPTVPSTTMERIRQPQQLRESLGGTLETQSSRQVDQIEGQ